MSKRVKIVIVSVLGVIIAGVTVTAFLWFTFGNNTRRYNQAVAMTPAQVVDKYQQQAGPLWSSYTVLAPEDLIMQFRAHGDGLFVEFPAAHYREYKHSGGARLSFDEVKQRTLAVLKPLAFTEMEAAATYVTYENPTKLCQIQKVTVGADFAFGCIVKGDADSKLALAKQLTSLAKATDTSLKLPDSAMIVIDEVRGANNSTYATLSFTSDEIATSQTGAPRLIFGKLGDTWEYVANVNNTTAKSDGRQRISEADRVRLQDPKWKGVLNSVY